MKVKGNATAAAVNETIDRDIIIIVGGRLFSPSTDLADLIRQAVESPARRRSKPRRARK